MKKSVIKGLIRYKFSMDSVYNILRAFVKADLINDNR